MLFVKNPIPGKTKTRLAASVGDDMALKMYGILTRWTRDQAAGLGDAVTRYVYYSSFIPDNDDWPEVDFSKRLQQGDDLGSRMQAAFSEVFAAGHDAIIVIGSDCPGITTAYLEQAFAALTLHDVVVGPALDGGYTLLGTRKEDADLFSDISWSTNTVLRETLTKATQQQLTYVEQETLSDVDYLEDWQSYGWPLPK
ncbi:TIGR04282 family arsenosugar biosynthesis glycosyltransferase [Lewinella sp. 4G2]|uniref:TIGR04282 family arsenosugar biosynthesis glycosyltransferase n=1 Tax=Lewinella sp. 4G2 TaxID=1803372 RepID=UPI00210124CC|nr:TIGR04282 family arsenosugar biosynthesis glycosyltransferase [Lewinella sp. 4G2]